MFIRRVAIKALSPHCIHEGLNARDALRRNQFSRTRGKHSGSHEIIHRLFSFHLADYRGDRLSRDRFSRQVPLFSSSPSLWMAGWPARRLYYEGNREGFAIIMLSTRGDGDSVYDRYRLRYTRISPCVAASILYLSTLTRQQLARETACARTRAHV